jgi:putative ABC transport system substrate-binding protein
MTVTIGRRELLAALGGAAAWPLAARSQQPTKTLKVGTVAGTPKSSPQWVAFERRMVELGYQEGRNFSPVRRDRGLGDGRAFGRARR